MGGVETQLTCMPLNAEASTGLGRPVYVSIVRLESWHSLISKTLGDSSRRECREVNRSGTGRLTWAAWACAARWATSSAVVAIMAAVHSLSGVSVASLKAATAASPGPSCMSHEQLLDDTIYSNHAWTLSSSLSVRHVRGGRGWGQWRWRGRVCVTTGMKEED